MHQFENHFKTWLNLKPEVKPKLVNSYTEVFWPRNESQEPIRNENGITESETLCDIFSNLNINSTVSLDKMKKIFKDESNWSRAEAGFQNAWSTQTSADSSIRVLSLSRFCPTCVESSVAF